MNRKSYMYILTNKRNGTLYVGVTSDLTKRVWQHKKGLADYWIPRSSRGKTTLQSSIHHTHSKIEPKIFIHFHS